MTAMKRAHSWWQDHSNTILRWGLGLVTSLGFAIGSTAIGLAWNHEARLTKQETKTDGEATLLREMRDDVKAMRGELSELRGELNARKGLP